jgi:hypothetical protein
LHFPLLWDCEKDQGSITELCEFGGTSALAVIAVFAPSFLEQFFDLLESRAGLSTVLVLRCFATFDLGDGDGEDWIVDRECLLPHFLEHVVAGGWQDSVVARLCCSVRYGDARALQLLLSHQDFTVRPDVFICCMEGDCRRAIRMDPNGLSAAVSPEEKEVQCRKLSLLVERFPDEARSYRSDGTHYTLLHHCAIGGDSARARVLLEAGVDPNVKDAKGQRASELIVFNPDESQHWTLMELMPGSDEEKNELLRRVPVSGSFFSGAVASFCAYCMILVAAGVLPLLRTFLLCAILVALVQLVCWNIVVMVDRRVRKYLNPLVDWSHCSDFLGRPGPCAVVLLSLVVVSVCFEIAQATRIFIVVDVVCIASATPYLPDHRVQSRAAVRVMVLCVLLIVSVFFYLAVCAQVYSAFGALVTHGVAKLLLFNHLFALVSGRSSFGVLKAVLRHWILSSVAIAATMAGIANRQSCLSAGVCSAVAQLLLCVAAIWKFDIGASLNGSGRARAAAGSFCVIVVLHGWFLFGWKNVYVFIEGDAPVAASCFVLLVLFWLLVRYWPAPLSVSKRRENA